MRMTRKPALWGLLLFSASSLHAQGMAYRVPSGASRHTSWPSDSELTDPFSAIQVQPATPARMTPSPEVVSVHELAIPPKAAKEFQHSMKALQSRDFHSAADHLEKALQIAPDFAQARNNLGAAYINLHEYESAVAQLQKAIELAPNLKQPYVNLGTALISLGRLPEAETAARRGLDLAPQSSSARYNLGRILALAGRDTPEAVEMLSLAAADMQDARLPLALVLLRSGSTDQAIAQLQAYLKDPDPDKKEKVKAWLAKLTRESANREVPPGKPEH